MSAPEGPPRFEPVERAIRGRESDDHYLWIRDTTDRHRAEHHCWAYPFSDGTILGAIAEQTKAHHILELGTALGYTACWWAHHGATVDTVEADPIHVRLARENVAAAGLARRVRVHHGDFAEVLAKLEGSYDIAFFDGYEPEDSLLAAVRDRIRDGILVTTNLDLGAGDARQSLSRLQGWDTSYTGEIALTVPTDS